MKQLTKLANTTKKSLKIKFDTNGVKFLEEYIERIKTQIPKEDWNGLIISCGAFLGQCIIENYGGNWVKEENGTIAIELDKKNKVYPLAKVAKQFENGIEDSIFYLYQIIPSVFKLQPKPTKKKWIFWK